MRRGTGERSFTLIELMGVVIIMAIIVTVGTLALPRLSKQLAVNRAGQQVLNAIHYARQLAITQRIPTCIYFKDNNVGVAMKNVFYASAAAVGRGESWIDNTAYRYNTQRGGRDRSFPLGAVFLAPRGGNDGGPNYAGWTMANYGVHFVESTSRTFQYGTNVLVRWNELRTSDHPAPWAFYKIRFDRFGTPDITTTLIITEAISQKVTVWYTDAGEPNLTSSNRFYIALTKGSREIRSWRD